MPLGVGSFFVIGIACADDVINTFIGAKVGPRTGASQDRGKTTPETPSIIDKGLREGSENSYSSRVRSSVSSESPIFDPWSEENK